MSYNIAQSKNSFLLEGRSKVAYLGGNVRLVQGPTSTLTRLSSSGNSSVPVKSATSKEMPGLRLFAKYQRASNKIKREVKGSEPTATLKAPKFRPSGSTLHESS